MSKRNKLALSLFFFPLMSASSLLGIFSILGVFKSFPLSGCSPSRCCGYYTVSEFLTQANTVLAEVPWSSDELTLAFNALAKRGVLLSCGDEVTCEPRYRINTGMVQQNYSNIMFLQLQDGYNGFIPGPCSGSMNGQTGWTGTNSSASSSIGTQPCTGTSLVQGSSGGCGR